MNRAAASIHSSSELSTTMLSSAEYALVLLMETSKRRRDGTVVHSAIRETRQDNESQQIVLEIGNPRCEVPPSKKQAERKSRRNRSPPAPTSKREVDSIPEKKHLEVCRGCRPKIPKRTTSDPLLQWILAFVPPPSASRSPEEVQGERDEPVEESHGNVE